MKFDEIIENRHSSRSFKDKKVNFEHILEAIDASLKGPFAGNLNNLKFLIIEEEKTIREIAKFSHQEWINEAQAIIVVCSNDIHLENQYGERGRIYSRQQAGAAIVTILFKLTELGINSCWVGAYQDELIKQLLDIPSHIQIEAIIPLGYEKGIVKKPRKISLENAIRWENFETTKRPTIFKEPPLYRE
ncbi:MAG: nitroreductase family protein [Candidatus Pacearchaeota archaeon]|nr:nitroreductase family protein [Candidatus Pacearchaeota archaeon]